MLISSLFHFTPVGSLLANYEGNGNGSLTRQKVIEQYNVYWAAQRHMRYEPWQISLPIFAKLNAKSLYSKNISKLEPERPFF